MDQHDRRTILWGGTIRDARVHPEAADHGPGIRHTARGGYTGETFENRYNPYKIPPSINTYSLYLQYSCRQ